MEARAGLSLSRAAPPTADLCAGGQSEIQVVVYFLFILIRVLHTSETFRRDGDIRLGEREEEASRIILRVFTDLGDSMKTFTTPLP